MTRTITAGGHVRVAIAVLAVVAAAMPWIAAFRLTNHADFDLYYYGGRVERHGSFTDTKRVLAEADADGEHPTRSDVFGSPVLVALVFQPLSLLPLHVAQRVFLVCAAALVVLALWLSAPRWWPGWLLVLSLTSGVLFALALGQVSMGTLALVVIAWACVRDRRDGAAGTALGVAAALKLYPAFIAVALVAHRRWRAVWAFVVTVAALALLSVPALGARDVSAAVNRTREVSGTVDATRQNQSLPAVINRATGSTDAGHVAAVALPLAAAAVIMLRPRRRAHATFAAAAIAAVVCQGIAWEHYAPLAVVGLLALAAERPSRSAVIGAALGWGLIAMPRFYDNLDSTVHAWSEVGAPRTAGLLLVLVSLWVATRVRHDGLDARVRRRMDADAATNISPAARSSSGTTSRPQ
jgi:alpha-1,2-mannosyltransferase